MTSYVTMASTVPVPPFSALSPHALRLACIALALGCMASPACVRADDASQASPTRELGDVEIAASPLHSSTMTAAQEEFLFGQKPVTMGNGSPFELAFLWEATMHGGADLLYYYLNKDYTMNKDEGAEAGRALLYSPEHMDLLIKTTRQRQNNRYMLTDQSLHQAMSRHSVKGKKVLVVGSQVPTYEAYALAYGAAEVVVVEYNLPQVTSWYPGTRYITPAQLTASGSAERFDAVLSISSIEHDGLGRYGDPLSAWADLDSMRALLHTHMKPGGLMFLAVPTGRDAVIFNAARVYGFRRLSLITAGWEPVDSFGFLLTDLNLELENLWLNQPLFVLRAPVVISEGVHVPVSGQGSTTAPVPVLLPAVTLDADSVALSSFQHWSSVALKYIARRRADGGGGDDDELAGRVGGPAAGFTLFPGDLLQHRDALRSHELCGSPSETGSRSQPEPKGPPPNVVISSSGIRWAGGVLYITLHTAGVSFDGPNAQRICLMVELRLVTGRIASFNTGHCFDFPFIEDQAVYSETPETGDVASIVAVFEVYQLSDMSLVCTSGTMSLIVR